MEIPTLGNYDSRIQWGDSCNRRLDLLRGQIPTPLGFRRLRATGLQRLWREHGASKFVGREKLAPLEAINQLEGGTLRRRFGLFRHVKHHVVGRLAEGVENSPQWRRSHRDRPTINENGTPSSRCLRHWGGVGMGTPESPTCSPSPRILRVYGSVDPVFQVCVIVKLMQMPQSHKATLRYSLLL